MGWLYLVPVLLDEHRKVSEQAANSDGMEVELNWWNQQLMVGKVMVPPEVPDKYQ